MAANSVTVGATNVSLWTTYLIKKAIPGLKANLFFSNYCEPAMIPKGAGHYVARWLVPQYRVGSTTALTDGTSGSKASMVNISGVEGTIADYGEWFEITDLALESEPTTALDTYKDIVAYAGAGAIDKRLYTAGIGATNFLHARDTTITGVTLTSADHLIAQDFAIVSGFFNARNAQGFDSLAGDYLLAIHPDAETYLVTDVTTGRLSWSDVKKHTPDGYAELASSPRFVGRLSNVTALRTTQITELVEDVTAHACLALARWGIGWLGLGESGPKAPEIKFKQPGPQSTNDPLDTLHTLGWKVRMAEKLLDGANRALVVYSAI